MKHTIGSKITVYIALVVVLTFSISIGVSQFFLPKYYLHQLNQNVTQAISTYKEIGDESLVEHQFDVTILSVSINENTNALNENLKQQLTSKHIALNRFWVSDEVLEQVTKDKYVGKLYDQGKQKSSFIAHYTREGDRLVMVGASIADFNIIVKFINRFNLVFLLVSILVIVIITALLSKKVTKPLIELKKVAKDIGQLDFKQAEIHTGDEIEDLAGSINKMSQELEKAQKTLSKRNFDLKQFMTGLTHEIKTPLALIKVYSSGIEDGMDDGTYLTIINKQVDRMEKIISDMLYFSKNEENNSRKIQLDFIKLIKELIGDYRHVNEDKIIHFHSNTVEFNMMAEKEKVSFIFDNLLSNAIKYSTGKEIKIFFSKDGVFKISNDTSLNEISDIWKPFYVGESSRDKNFSGTGLGLPTVKSLCEQAGYSVEVMLSDGEILFVIDFRHIPVTKPS